MCLSMNVNSFREKSKEKAGSGGETRKHCESTNGMGKEMASMDSTIDEVKSSAENVAVSDKNSQDLLHEKEVSEGIVKKPLRRSTRT